MLIDLGPDWGHIVPLNVLTNIIRISYDSHKVTLHYREGDKNMELQSNAVVDSQVLISDIIPIINGIIPKDRMRLILSGIQAQVGKDIPDILDRQIPDIGALRKLWAEINDDPYMQFGLSYDKDEDSVNFDVEFNEKFKDVMDKWLDNVTNEVVQSDEEKALIFVLEAIKNVIEPMKPSNELPPDEDLPTMIMPTTVEF